MPRIVDREERKQTIANAVFRVIGRDGMDAVSLRDVAAEADLSMGSIQHYFSTKDEMLLFALEHMRARVLIRFEAKLANIKKPTTKRYLRTMLQMLLPTDDESRQEAIVNISFFASSVNNDRFRDLLREGYSGLLEAVEFRLRTARDAGELQEGTDVEVAAAQLFFTAQGLVGPVLLGVTTPRRAVAVLDAHLDRIFTS
ncbi:MAG: TetR family transcriptional regulator C-terminal domain-containing protein [Candidatus Nanopelagicales bacterium]